CGVLLPRLSYRGNLEMPRTAGLYADRVLASRTGLDAFYSFYHFRNIVDASYKDGGSPNNDTLYSWGFFDLSKEPVVLAHPDMGERYFTFELADMYASNFGYVGKRTTGSKAGAFLIAGPNWKGEKPADVREVIVSRTPYAVVFGRTFVKAPDDVPLV